LAWTSPLTWTVAQLVTAANLNTHIRDNLNALSGHTHTGAAGDGSANISPTTITMGGALYQRKGADVASATTLAIGTDGNYFNVTGGTTIQAITTRAAGTVITLHFDSSLTVTNGSGITLVPASSWVAPANAMLTLVSHGSNDWREISRATPAAATMGYQWLEPSTINGTDAQAARVAGTPPSFGTGATTATFGFVIPDDLTTMVTARSYRVGGAGNVSLLGSFSTLTPGAIATVNDSIGGGGGAWYGLYVAWRA
jgi:hypothetical protein